MKVLVYTHHLEIGGSQVNAIDLATAVQDSLDVEVVIFGTPGPAVKLISERGLKYLPAPKPRYHPSLAMIRTLFDAIESEHVDLVHAWDWPQVIDSYYASYMGRRVPVLGSLMSMTVNRGMPAAIPLTLGTAQLADYAQRVHPARVELLEPPVDTDQDNADVLDRVWARHQLGLGDGTIAVVVVSRLVSWLKLEGIQRAIDAVGALAASRQIRLVIVGEGTAAAQLQEHADLINEREGRLVIQMTGAMMDPRPAYAAADIMLGMGGSALRGLAFGKASIVLGEGGFSQILTPQTAEGFLWRGWYGIGDGTVSSTRLAQQIDELADDQERRAELGCFGLELINSHYALNRTAKELIRLYSEVVEQGVQRRRHATDVLRLIPRHFVPQVAPPIVMSALHRFRHREIP